MNKGNAHLRFVVAAALALLSLTALGLWRTAAIASRGESKVEQEARIRRLHSMVRQGVGSEVSMAGARASHEQVGAAVDSLAGFIGKRSGLRLGKSVVARLATMEENVLNESRRRVTADEFSEALTQTFVERLRAVSDQELEQATSVMTARNGVAAASSQARPPVKLRANGAGGLSADEFLSQARLMRSSLASPVLAMAVVAQVRAAIKQQVTHRLDMLSQAVPEQWGAAMTDGLTPAQALLVAYSVASDDYLWRSEGELRGVMKGVEQAMKAKAIDYPVADGRFAYGTSGYLFASPLDLVFDHQTTARLLDRLQERSAK